MSETQRRRRARRVQDVNDEKSSMAIDGAMP